MKFDVLTIFPDIFRSYAGESIIGRAAGKKIVEIKIFNIRDFARDKHKKVDDRPYGGGPGMVFKIEPLIKAISSILKIKNSKFGIKKKTEVILFSPAGKQFDNKMAAQLAKNYDHLILICGRYEGVDARLKKVVRDLGVKVEEVSVGPYVLTGGELPALILADAITRRLPGALGKEESVEEKRSGIGVPVYTRPEVFEFGGKKYRTPKVLLSGNRAKISEWRKKAAEK